MVGCLPLVAGVGVVVVLVLVCRCRTLRVDLWPIVALHPVLIGECECIAVCLLIATALTWYRGGVTKACRIGSGMLLLRSAAVKVLLMLSRATMLMIPKVGPGGKALVVAPIVPRLCGANVCSVRRMWPLSRLRTAVGMLLGNRETKQMLIFPEWTRCMIRLICRIRVGGVLLNSRRVLLKKNISPGWLRLLILGRALNSLESTYSRKSEQSCGPRTSRLVVSMPTMLCLDTLRCTRLVSLSVGLLKKSVLFLRLSWSSVCRRVLTDRASMRLHCRETLPVPLLMKVRTVCRLLRLSSSRLVLLVIPNVIRSMFLRALPVLRTCVSSAGLTLSTAAWIGRLSPLQRL